jgi:hypothetical protein
MIRYIHWNAEEAAERAARIRAAGYEVNHRLPMGAAAMRELGEKPPAAVVIDLGRLPGQGRDMAMMLRQRKTTRHLPIVMIEGDPAKMEKIRKGLPDAVFTSWSRIRSALRKAIAHPPKDPVVPASSLAGYSGTPLPKKLGIKPESVLALINAPLGFEKRIGKLPRGLTVRKQLRGRCDRIIWFTRKSKEIERRLDAVKRAMAEGGALWIAWPKKSSGVPSDLTQQKVRKIGLASGLVDYKVCSIDKTWSGLLFARRKR